MASLFFVYFFTIDRETARSASVVQSPKVLFGRTLKFTERVRSSSECLSDRVCNYIYIYIMYDMVMWKRNREEKGINALARRIRRMFVRRTIFRVAIESRVDAGLVSFIICTWYFL